MRKNLLLSGIVSMVAVLLLTMIAYRVSLTASERYDQRMHEDIQTCAQQLTAAGVSTAQVQAVQSVLNEVNHHTLNYVSSAVDSVIGTVGFMGVVIMTSIFAMRGSATSRSEP